MFEKIRPYLRKGETHQMPATTAVAGMLKMLGFDPASYAVFEIWDRESEAVVKGCKATGLSGTRLVVTVPSAAHRQELMYVKDRIVARVNQAMGRRVVRDVQFEFLTGGQGEQNEIRVGSGRGR